MKILLIGKEARVYSNYTVKDIKNAYKEFEALTEEEFEEMKKNLKE